MCAPATDIATYPALRSRGLTRRGIEAALRSGELIRLRVGVYASPNSCRAARTAALHGGSLACVTAAQHVGIWVRDFGEELHVWMRAHGHVAPHADCACISHWDGGPAADSFGIPSVPRILLQISRCTTVEEFFAAVESALNQRLLGRAGRRWLRERVDRACQDAVDFAGSDAQSGLESLVRWRLRRFGLQIRSQVAIVGVGIVDLLIGERLIVELDGSRNHDDATHRHKDLARDAGAAIWGYVTLRFDYAMVVHDWPTVEHAILAAVASGRHRR
jgi:very-short-patch-repair endonuclease